STTDKAETVFAPSTSKSLIKAILACPHGVLKMSEDIPGLVETSTNLASVKMIGDEVVFETSQRSSVTEEKEKIRKMVYDAFATNGASSVESDEGYPGWKPNVNSKIKNIAVDTYKKLFNVTPNVGAIHAGLECGLIIEKYPDLDMISIGPTIIGNHSPAEKVSIPTVEMTWKHVLAIIDTIRNS
ncbi:MAG: cytosol nonspecific dipeptidase, partial [Paludibacteraceae bacterium]|nr:cytosol nonspecific dipeptidase [Paludibacteraceae bacterium]